MTDQETSIGSELAQSGTERKTRLGRTHQDYWKSRLSKRSYEWGGKTIEIPEWQVRIAHRGRREWFNLRTPNQSSAAIKARDIYLSIVSGGWEATIAKFKPEMLVDSEVATVGEFLDHVKTQSPLRQVTFGIYARKFRTLVAGVFGIKGGVEKFDYVAGGRAGWLERINRVRLSRLTATRVEAWKVQYLKSAEKKDPVSYKRARTTLNSIIRGSRSLFSRKVLTHITAAKLPAPLPLQDVSNVKVERSRYKSTFDPQALLVAARRELSEAVGEASEDKHEQFKIILLALGAGLRRHEIDILEWRHIDWKRNVISVETTQYGSTKSHESENEVDVDPGLLEILRDYMRPGSGEFVIKSISRPKPNNGVTYWYRCECHFNALIEWLRSKGVNGLNPLHALRKEFGSQIAAQGGIFLASRQLRHSDIQLTRDYYLDKKQTTVFEISKMLGESGRRCPSRIMASGQEPQPPPPQRRRG
jgi:integrase